MNYGKKTQITNMSNTISTQICRSNACTEKGFSFLVYFSLAFFVKWTPAPPNSWVWCLEWITDKKRKAGSFPGLFLLMSGTKVWLLVGTSSKCAKISFPWMGLMNPYSTGEERWKRIKTKRPQKEEFCLGIWFVDMEKKIKEGWL